MPLDFEAGAIVNVNRLNIDLDVRSTLVKWIIYGGICLRSGSRLCYR